MKLKIFKQIAFLLVAGVAGLGLGVAIMWNTRGVSAAEQSGHKHPLVYNNGTPATCEQAGSYGYWSCAECDLRYSDANGTMVVASEDLIIPQLQHKLTFVAQQISTCGHEGVKAHYECEYCHKKFRDENGKNEVTDADLVIAKIAHTNMKLVAAKTATCTEQGCYEHWHCDDCGENFQDPAGKIPFPSAIIDYKHDAHYVAPMEVTCEHEGTIAHFHCDDCGKNFADEACHEVLADVTLPVLDHAGNFIDDEVKPTCTKNGHPAYFKCIHGCDKYYLLDGTEYDPANIPDEYKAYGHNYVTNYVPATDPYRLYDDAANLRFDMQRVCTHCGDLGDTVSVSAFAQDDTYGAATAYTSKEVDGQVIVDKDVITLGSVNANHDAVVRLIIPQTYVEGRSVIRYQGNVIEPVFDESETLRKVMVLNVHFADIHDELLLEFDFNGNGAFEQTIVIKVA